MDEDGEKSGFRNNFLFVAALHLIGLGECCFSLRTPAKSHPRQWSG
jgi:hypothetical protein